MTLAMTDLIPMVGATLGAAICIIVSVFTAGMWSQAVVGLLFFIAYQQLEKYLIFPQYRRHVRHGAPPRIPCSYTRRPTRE